MENHPLRVISIPYCTFFPHAFRTLNPAAPISTRARELPSSPTYLQRSHFSIYGSAVQMQLLDIQPHKHTAPILIGFSNDYRFWLGAVESAWRGTNVNEQP
ncbi:hypothetical protein AVEN_158450-1 [Araneus ventricosus]|uniref:Uncharacterized protein n=1 Tax=Araneus ventricosus TaxID=182803 RepID=A0A4Y2UG16_ARAVE|nr:hypothetical protein AVEN_43847-1 [Araneus ventricosus]GBO10520.1 hypothetical protein AVEN_158450-1 [Araneus ventricosus]